MLASETPTHQDQLLPTLGDPALDKIRASWPQGEISGETVDLLKAVPTADRRRVMLALYCSVAEGRGLANTYLARCVISRAGAAINGELSPAQLEQNYAWAGNFLNNSGQRGNCAISTIVLSPELKDDDLRGYLNAFRQAASDPKFDANAIVSQTLLGG